MGTEFNYFDANLKERSTYDFLEIFFCYLNILIIFRLTTYLLSASWIKIQDQNLLVAAWSNRYQNNTLITLCSYKLGNCVPVNFFLMEILNFKFLELRSKIFI